MLRPYKKNHQPGNLWYPSRVVVAGPSLKAHQGGGENFAGKFSLLRKVAKFSPKFLWHVIGVYQVERRDKEEGTLPLGQAISSFVFWYRLLATLWCDSQLFVISVLCNLHVSDPARAHQEISGTIQSPPGNIRNHPKPARKYQEPSRAH